MERDDIKSRRYRLSSDFKNPTKYLRKRLNHYRRITIKEPKRMFKICLNPWSAWTIRNGVISYERFEPAPRKCEADGIISGSWSTEASQRLKDLLPRPSSNSMQGERCIP